MATKESAANPVGRGDPPAGRQGALTHTSIATGARVAVASDLALVADTVAAALAGFGVRASVTPWRPSSESGRETEDWGAPVGAPHAPGPDVVLIISGLDSAARLDELRDRGPRCTAPWLVMADCERGPAWGAVLEAGARAVVPSSIALRDLVDVLDAVLRGDSPIDAGDRVALLRQWWAARDDHEQLRVRMRSLSPRERLVLSMLVEGTMVRDIADRLDVSEATVRSQVKAILRKLAVASQLAAVAAVGQLEANGRYGHQA